MKTFLRTIIGGAIGVGALYVVGKIAFEAGRDYAEVERQLKENGIGSEPKTDEESTKKAADNSEKTEEDPEDPDDPDGKPARSRVRDLISEAWEASKERPTVPGRIAGTVRNLKTALKAKKLFGGGNRKPGVLSTLLNNPEGAKIEAFVKDGSVRINVQPGAA